MPNLDRPLVMLCVLHCLRISGVLSQTISDTFCETNSKPRRSLIERPIILIAKPSSRKGHISCIGSSDGSNTSLFLLELPHKNTSLNIHRLSQRSSISLRHSQSVIGPPFDARSPPRPFTTKRRPSPSAFPSVLDLRTERYRPPSPASRVTLDRCAPF